MEDKIEKLILAHIRFRESFIEVPAGFTRAFERNGKSFTFLGMDSAIREHLQKTVKKITTVATTF